VVRAARLDAALDELGYGGRTVATALNGAFVPAPARAATTLAEGDRLEVVAPRQGG
jgi:sulfur carrier protein